MATSPREEAVELLNTRDLTTLPVVDGGFRVIGVLSHDALIQSVREDATAGLQTMVGAGKEERALSSPSLGMASRYALNLSHSARFFHVSVMEPKLGASAELILRRRAL